MQLIELLLKLGEVLLVHKGFDQIVPGHILLMHQLFDQAMFIQQGDDLLQAFLQTFF